MSKKIVIANKAFFGEKLKEKLEPTLLEYVKVIDEGETPFVDNYGRETQYYAQLDEKKIWLY